MYNDLIQHQPTETSLSFSKQFKLELFTLEQLKPLKVITYKDDVQARTLIEQKKVDILLNPHLAQGKDPMHSKHSGLNQVLCELARKQDVAIGITLDTCTTPVALGRIFQNVVLCRKYHVPLFLFTFAKNPYELRNPKDLLSFCTLLGMNSSQALTAVSGLTAFLKRKSIK
ncbi:MAG: RNase P subunit p30 family protein [Candidatus Nanoarchaeia archaeon]